MPKKPPESMAHLAIFLLPAAVAMDLDVEAIKRLPWDAAAAASARETLDRIEAMARRLRSAVGCRWCGEDEGEIASSPDGYCRDRCRESAGVPIPQR